MQGDGGRRYDDGQWHSIVATRRGAVGTIVVNNQYRGKCSHIHTNTVCVFMLLSTCECVMHLRLFTVLYVCKSLSPAWRY